MFYWLYQQFGGGEYVPVLNLLKYITFRTGLALFTAQIVVMLMGSRFIRWMQAKQGKGQPIRTDGIQRHVLEKAGTPTMGGFMILAGLLVGTLLWSDLSNVYVWMVVLVTAGYGVLGKEAPAFVALPALPVTKDNLLEAWQTVYRAEAPANITGSMN